MAELTDAHPSYQRLLKALSEALGHEVEGTTAVAKALDGTPQMANNWPKRGVSKDGAESAQRKYGINAVWVRYGDGPPTVGAYDDYEQGARANGSEEPSIASQSSGLDLEKLRTSIEYVIDAYLYTETPINSRGVARLSAGVYDYLIGDEPANLIELGDRLKRQVRRENVGQIKAGSADKSVQGRTKRKAVV